MKKLFVLVVASLIAISGVSAASLTIGGTVTQNLTAELTADNTMALTFDGAGSAAAGDAAAGLKVISNKKNWTITFSSLNSGVLTNGQTGDALSTIPYKLAVAITAPDFGTGAVFTNGLATATQLTAAKTIVATVNARTTKLGSTLALTASVAAQEDADLLWDSKFTYEDTITISIAPN